ncbi:MAG TPA: lactonase family protein [Candidatus Acidoferrales bacterium]|jgi:6-phosphogluconolactonase|nr:lactonase family protein [Candidatus Acidoferrales bacterium]
MKITRRCFFLVLSCLLTILPASPQSPEQKFLVFVGTYTDKTDSKGIYTYEFDAATGKLTPKGLAAESSNPSWVVIHPNGKWAYAANESGKQSTISAFSVDAKSAKLTLLNKLPAAGEDPCYLSLDKTGKYLFVANYTSGNIVVFPILPDGKLGEHTSSIRDGGVLGPNKERQEAPHAHWVEVSPDNHFIFVTDLGLDRILTYRFDLSNGTLYGAPLSSYTRYKNAWSVPVNPGDGPRHAVLGANDHIYVLGELQSTVTDILLDPHKDIEPVQRISTIPPDYKGRNDAAEIALHPSGKWLFASNRGHDSIALFSVDPATGKLERAGDYSTGGKEPRHFAVDPTGRFLLAENQNSNSIVVFRIDPATGALSQVSTTEDVPSPVCLAFYPSR